MTVTRQNGNSCVQIQCLDLKTERKIFGCTELEQTRNVMFVDKALWVYCKTMYLNL